MPLHNWSNVESGIFHAFHTAWITEIQNALNTGLLPSSYYALAEQHAGDYVADVLTLHSPPTREELTRLNAEEPASGGTAIIIMISFCTQRPINSGTRSYSHVSITVQQRAQ